MERMGGSPVNGSAVEIPVEPGLHAATRRKGDGGDPTARRPQGRHRIACECPKAQGHNAASYSNAKSVEVFLFTKGGVRL